MINLNKWQKIWVGIFAFMLLVAVIAPEPTTENSSPASELGFNDVGTKQEQEAELGLVLPVKPQKEKPIFNLELTGALFDELKQEAREYEKSLLSSAKQLDHVNLPSYQSIAENFYAADQCQQAYDIYVATLAEQKKSTKTINWLPLAKYAHCARNQTRHLHSLFLNFEQLTKDEQKIEEFITIAPFIENHYMGDSKYHADIIKMFTKIVEWTDSSAFFDKLEYYQHRSSQVISKVYARDNRICFEVSNNIRFRDSSKNLEDYIRISPKVNVSLERTYWDDFCIRDLNWGTEYQVTVLQGLEIDGHILAESLYYSIKTENKTANVRFDNRDYILVKNNDFRIPIYSVNSEEVKLSLYQIPEQNLQNRFIRANFNHTLSNYSHDKISENFGDEIWSTKVKLKNGEKNTKLETAIDLPKEKMQQGGVYVLAASTNNNPMGYWEGAASQWIVVSDIGLTTFKGDDGITVMAHSLDSSKPIAGLDVRLYSKNNRVLESKTTDNMGKVFFDHSLLKGSGGREAVQLIASSKKHGFVFYPLASNSIDLSDRGVSGRMAPGELDAYLYSERGIYRPGDTIHVTTLLRDSQANAINGLPLTLKLTDPEGIMVAEQTIMPQGAGGYAWQKEISSSAKTGSWDITLYAAQDTPAIGRLSFLVEAIIPPKMQADLKRQGNQWLSYDDPMQVALKAKYYYGAAVAERPVQVKWSYEKAATPFLWYKDFQFSDQTNLDKTLSFAQQLTTDAQGEANITLQLSQAGLTANEIAQTLTELENIYQPLALNVSADVLDSDGRVTTVYGNYPIYHLPIYIGIKKSKSDQVKLSQISTIASEQGKTQHQFELITLNQQGVAQSFSGVSWRLVEQISHYQWFYKNGRWDSEYSIEENELESGSLSEQKTSVLSFMLASGNYCLQLKHESGVFNHYCFDVGEQKLSKADSMPDALKLSLDQKAYNTDDVAKLSIESPYSGTADVVIGTNKVHSVKQIELGAGKNELEIPFDPAWGAGAYIIVNAYHLPESDKQTSYEQQLRSLGVIWLSQAKQSHQLGLEFSVPEQLHPHQSISIPVQISGSTEPEVFLTLALVDEAVLDLTHFKTANPLEYYYKQRRLGLSLADNYSSLINTLAQDKDVTRVGGDGMGDESIPNANIQVLSLYSGIVTVNTSTTVQTTTVEIPFDLPDFNGKARLVAVAWNNKKMGQVDQLLTIKDPIVMQPSLPRFLAVGDKSQLSVQINNTSDTEGEFQLQLQASEGLQLDLAQQNFSLSKGEQKQLIFPITALNPSDVKMRLTLTGPNYRREYPLNLGIRWASLSETKTQLSNLAAGQKMSIKASINMDDSVISANNELFQQGSVQESVYLSSRFNINVPDLLASLDQYPYGCLEQLVSRAMPLLYFNQLATQWGIKTEPQLTARIEKAIAKILEKQRSDGSFGLWSSSSDEEKWLSAYAVDFLIQAKQLNYSVNPSQLENGIRELNWKVRHMDQPSDADLMSLAYAHYVLAKAGEGMIEDARYLAKEYEMPTLASTAQLASALALMGENILAQELFSQAKRFNPDNTKRGENWHWADYGSHLRDLSLYISLLDEVGFVQKNSDVYQQVLNWIKHQIAQGTNSFSTQEQAWLIRAALTLGAGEELQVKVNQQLLTDVGSEYQLSLFPASDIALDADNQLQIENTDPKHNVWLKQTIKGVKQQKAAQQNGMEISKKYYLLDGTRVNVNEVKQGQQLLVYIKGKSSTELSHRAMMVDLLPAGFELDMSDDRESILRTLALPQFDKFAIPTPWLYRKALDDRYIQAIDLTPRKPDFVVAYLVRAVTPGEYALAGSEVFDMYDSQYHANTAQQAIKVLAHE